ncbi:hypothetical protein [Pediococcus stilesii]|uniref:hypothetical protein n=1 Tax=Pediococcus stilesii TaxID=331679 RepID=UPI00070B2D10|nr:hypothetical protein [Pediococcus stilesii]
MDKGLIVNTKGGIFSIYGKSFSENLDFFFEIAKTSFEDQILSIEFKTGDRVLLMNPIVTVNDEFNLTISTADRIIVDCKLPINPKVTKRITYTQISAEEAKKESGSLESIVDIRGKNAFQIKWN